ncbi:hypothetical protein M5689_001073 [Euphorbia peplus]|nr:hypothetical protein M5689_001073 [Euphorbia peplus]
MNNERNPDNRVIDNVQLIDIPVQMDLNPLNVAPPSYMQNIISSSSNTSGDIITVPVDYTHCSLYSSFTYNKSMSSFLF